MGTQTVIPRLRPPDVQRRAFRTFYCTDLKVWKPLGLATPAAGDQEFVDLDASPSARRHHHSARE